VSENDLPAQGRISKKNFTIMPTHASALTGATTAKSNTEDMKQQMIMNSMPRRSSNLSDMKNNSTDSLRESVAQKLDKKAFQTNPSTFFRSQADSIKQKTGDEDPDILSDAAGKSTFRPTKLSALQKYGVSKDFLSQFLFK
jgi:hypothetical protein